MNADWKTKYELMNESWRKTRDEGLQILAKRLSGLGSEKETRQADVGWDTDVAHPCLHTLWFDSVASRIWTKFSGDWRNTGVKSLDDRIEDSNSAKRRGKLCRQT